MDNPREVAAELEGLQKDWWMYLLLGIALVVLGLVVMSIPIFTAVAVTMILGLLFIVGAVLQAVYAIKLHSKPGRTLLHVAMAILYLLAGLVLIAHPVSGTLLLTMLLSVFFFAEGVVKIVASIELRGMPHWGWTLFGGILSLLLGILIAAQWPSSAMWVIGLLLGIDLIYAGWTIVVLSVAAHGAFRQTPRLAGEH